MGVKRRRKPVYLEDIVATTFNNFVPYQSWGRVVQFESDGHYAYAVCGHHRWILAAPEDLELQINDLVDCIEKRFSELRDYFEASIPEDPCDLWATP